MIDDPLLQHEGAHAGAIPQVGSQIGAAGFRVRVARRRVVYRARKIHQIDPETGAILRTIESNRFVTGVTWVDGELWHATWEGNQSELRQVDPQSGKVLQQVEMPAGVGVSGLQSDGHDRFFCGGGGKVRVVRRPKGRDGAKPRA